VRIRVALTVAVGVALAACHATPPPAPAPKPRVKLAVLPAESDKFPGVAKATTEALVAAHVAGVDDTQLSKVSMEVVQLSIECVDTTPACYQAVGKSLDAGFLLFAEITAEAKKQVKVTVTLFDVAGSRAAHTAEKVYANATEASGALASLVAEATQ
jgi:hypothetical protein